MSDHADHDHDHQDGEHHVHVIPFMPMFVTFVLLLILTWATVWAATIPVSEFWHAFIAVAIAVVKAALVCAYFMHLKYEKPLNSLVLAASICGVLLFIGLTALDIGQRGVGSPMERGEIYEGGRLELFAGELPPAQLGGDPRPKAAMNIVEFAKQNAEAVSKNPAPGAPADGTAVGGSDGGGDGGDGEAGAAGGMENEGAG